MSKLLDNITKEDFITACDKYKPNKFMIFFSKYFSTGTTKKNYWVKQVFMGYLMLCFVAGFIGAVINAPNSYMVIPTLMFVGVLVPFGLIGLVYYLMNKNYTNKVRKELGLSVQDYIIVQNEYKKYLTFHD